MKTENVLTAGTFDSFWPAHEKSFSVAHAVAAAKDCARKRENIGAPLRAYRDLKVAWRVTTDSYLLLCCRHSSLTFQSLSSRAWTTRGLHFLPPFEEMFGGYNLWSIARAVYKPSVKCGPQNKENNGRVTDGLESREVKTQPWRRIMTARNFRLFLCGGHYACSGQFLDGSKRPGITKKKESPG